MTTKYTIREESGAHGFLYHRLGTPDGDLIGFIEPEQSDRAIKALEMHDRYEEAKESLTESDFPARCIEELTDRELGAYVRVQAMVALNWHTEYEIRGVENAYAAAYMLISLAQEVNTTSATINMNDVITFGNVSLCDWEVTVKRVEKGPAKSE